MGILGPILILGDKATATAGALYDKATGRGTYMTNRVAGFFSADGDQQIIKDLKQYHKEGNTAKLLEALEDIRTSTPAEIKDILGNGVSSANSTAVKVFRSIITSTDNLEVRDKALEVIFDYFKSDQAIKSFTQGCAIPRSEANEILDSLHDYLANRDYDATRKNSASDLASRLGYHQVTKNQKVRVEADSLDPNTIPLEADIEAGERRYSASKGKFNFLHVLRQSGQAGAAIYGILCPEGNKSQFYADNMELLASGLTDKRDRSYNNPLVAQNAYDQLRRELPSVPFDSVNLNMVDPLTGNVEQDYTLGTFVQEFMGHEPNAQEQAVYGLIRAYYNVEAQKQTAQTAHLEMGEVARSTLIRNLNNKQVTMLKQIFGPDGIAQEGKLGAMLHKRAKAIVSSPEAVNLAICTAADALIDPNMDAQVHKFASHFQKTFGQKLHYDTGTVDATGAPITAEVKDIQDLVKAREQIGETLDEHLLTVSNEIFAGTTVPQISQDADSFSRLLRDMETAGHEATTKEAEALTEYNNDHSDINDIKRQCAVASDSRLADDATISITLGQNQADFLRALLGRKDTKKIPSTWDNYRNKKQDGFKGVEIKAKQEITLTKAQALKITELIKEDGTAGPHTTMLAKRDADRRKTVLADYQQQVTGLMQAYQTNVPENAFKIKPSAIDISDCLDVRDAQLRINNEVMKPLADQGAGPELHVKQGKHMEFLDELASRTHISNPEARPLAKAEKLILDIITDDNREYQKSNPAYVDAAETISMTDDKAAKLYESPDLTRLSKYSPKRQANYRGQGVIAQFLGARDASGTHFDAKRVRFAALEMLKRVGDSEDPVAVDARKMIYTEMLGIKADQLNDLGHLIITNEGDKAFQQRIEDTFGPSKFRVNGKGQIDGGEYARIHTLQHRLDEINVNLPQMREVANSQLFIDLSRFGFFSWDKAAIDKNAVISGLKEIRDNLSEMNRTTSPARLTELRTRNLELSGFAKIGLGGDHHDKLDDLLQRSHVLDSSRDSYDIFTQIMQYIDQLLNSLMKQAAAPMN